MTQDLVGGTRSTSGRKALVCGAGGFIGGHLVEKLKREGYWVRGVDIKKGAYVSRVDEPRWLDLRSPQQCVKALSVSGGFDEVYQLAANFGGVWFITNREREIVHDNTLINTHMADYATRMGVPRYFFSSSVCVYRDMEPDEPEITEADAYPACPENEYGWEKLYAERVATTFGRNSDTQVRIARFETCYGPGECWQGGREKAPAAMCRKVAEAEDGDTITIWGDGSAIRAFSYVGDIVDGAYTLMQSDLEGPVNIGATERVTINDLVRTVAEVAGKEIHIGYTTGPTGHHARNFSKARIRSLGWEPKVSLKEGIGYSYPVIEAQVRHG